MTTNIEAQRRAVDDLVAWHGEDLGDLLDRLIDEADQAGVVRRKVRDLMDGIDGLAPNGESPWNTAKRLRIVSGQSGRFMVDQEALFAEAARVRQYMAAQDQAMRTQERIMTRDVSLYRRDRKAP